MRLAQLDQHGGTHLCLIEDQRAIDLTKTAAKFSLPLPRNMREAIEMADMLAERVEAAREYAVEVDLSQAEYAPVISDPGKIICVGINYRKHIDECGAKYPSAPVLFGKFSNTLSAHNRCIAMPGTSVQIDYEAELVIVIGRGGKHIPRERALSHAFGYTCGNDVSARDLQMLSGQWLIGKSQDGFAPIGPWIVTADALNPDQLQIGSKVNGRQRQLANTSDMIFDCATIISYASDMMTLEPGDLIFTGTPSGVIMGYPESERVWLKPGDVVEVEIEGIGTLSNPVCAPE